MYMGILNGEIYGELYLRTICENGKEKLYIYSGLPEFYSEFFNL